MGQAKLTDFDRRKSWPISLQRTASKIELCLADAPSIVNMSQPHSESTLDELLTIANIRSVHDIYDEQLAELFISRNAHLYRSSLEVKRNSSADYINSHYGDEPAWRKGSWVYYPWNGQLIHILEPKLYDELRTIRNRNLITAEEQELYASFRVGCLGMSVGSSAAIALGLSGASRQLKISDSAVISGSNLNRIITRSASVGEEKSLVIARQLYEMNPYFEIARFSESINADNIGSFFEDPWPLQVVVDEIDSLDVKIRLRVEARKRGIPVIMATDLGDDVMIDIERFDLDNKLPLFHGLAGTIEDVLDQELAPRQWLKYATMIIGTRNVPLRMQKSLLQVGTLLPTQPQLGSTAMAAGAAVAFAVRQLALSGPLKSGRHMVSFSQALLEGESSWRHKRAHRKHSRIVDRSLEAM